MPTQTLDEYLDHTGTGKRPPGPDGQGMQQQGTGQQKLTPDEVRVLKECSNEAFMYRCLPFGVALMGLTQYAISRGHLSSRARGLKLAGASLAGFISGNISYQGACREKVMQLQNSPLADRVRRGKGQGVSGGLGQQWDSTLGDPGVQQQPQYAGQMDIEAQAPQTPRELDDHKRPNLDSDSKLPSQTEEPQLQQYQSYDDLRRRNRDEFYAKNNMKTPAAASSPPTAPLYGVQQPAYGEQPVFGGQQPSYGAQQPSTSRNKPAFPRSGPKNEYGDDMG